MTASVPPDLIGDRYELYRVVTDLDALHEAFRDRVEDLQITRLEVDAAGGLQAGYSSKLLCPIPMKTLGRESLPRMLRATGLALCLVIDDARFAPVKERLAKRRRPIRRTIQRTKPLSKEALGQIIAETFANHGRVGGTRRFALLSPKQRRKLAQAGAKARWSKTFTRKKGASPAE